jgi:hypothetical protein
VDRRSSRKHISFAARCRAAAKNTAQGIRAAAFFYWHRIPSVSPAVLPLDNLRKRTCDYAGLFLSIILLACAAMSGEESNCDHILILSFHERVDIRYYFAQPARLVIERMEP